MKYFINQLRQHLGRLALLVGVFLLCGFTSRAWAFTFSYTGNSLAIYGSGTETLTKDVLAAALVDRIDYCEKNLRYTTGYSKGPSTIYIGAGVSTIAAETFDALDDYGSVGLQIASDENCALKFENHSLNHVYSISVNRYLTCNTTQISAVEYDIDLWSTSATDKSLYSLSFGYNASAFRYMFSDVKVYNLSFADDTFWQHLYLDSDFNLNLYFYAVENLGFGPDITEIPDYFLCGSLYLQTVDCTNKYCHICENAFYQCPNVTIPGNAPSTTSTFGEWQSFYGVSSTESSSATTVIIPNDNVAAHAWTSSDNLTKRFPNLQTVIFLEDVTKVGNCICWESTHLNTVVFNNDNLTEIGDYAFLGCSSLSSIALPQNLTTIGFEAFTGCTSLKEVTIPSTVTSIGDLAFSNCTSLKATINSSSILNPSTAYTSSSNLATSIFNKVPSIVIGGNITTIGTYAFYGATGLKSLTLGEGMMTIGTSAFSGCTALTDLTINSNTIASKTYTSASNLADIFPYVTSLTYGSSVTSVGNYSFIVADTETYPLETITFKGIPAIGRSAFCCNKSLETVKGKVKSVYEYSFSECSSLKSIVITDDDVINNYAFNDCVALTSVSLPDNLTSIEKYAFYRTSLTGTLTIGSSCTSIGECAFYGTKITGIDLTKATQLTTIEGFTFYNCDGLTLVSIPANITSIKDYAFYGSDNLATATFDGSTTYQTHSFPEGTVILSTITLESETSYDDWRTYYKTLYQDLSKVTELYIPNDVIAGYWDDENPLYGDFTNVRTVRFGKAVTTIGDKFCYNMSSVEYVEFDGNNVKTIGAQAFMYCSKLYFMTLPESVTTIGSKSFYGTGLQSVTIPASVTSLAADAFDESKISNLRIESPTIASKSYSSNYLSISFPYVEKVTFGSAVSTLGSNIFQNQNSGTPGSSFPLSQVIFESEDPVTIGYRAFEGCRNLSQVSGAIHNPGLCAFSDCSSLTAITMDDATLAIGVKAFQYAGLTSITLPSQLTSIGAEAFSYTALESVTIPASVTTMGSDVFYHCSSLESVTIESAYLLNSIEFTTTSNLTSCFAGVKNIILADNVFGIGSGYAFYGDTDLESLTLGSRITNPVDIAASAFSGCTNLKTLRIESPYYAGNYNWGEELTISTYFPNLTTVIFGSNTEDVGEYMFYQHANLEKVIFEGGDKSIQKGAFQQCPKLETVTGLFDNVYEAAFAYDDKLTSVDLASEPYVIGNSAFCNCSLLESINLRKARTIGEYAFNSCQKLSSPTLSSSLTEIAEGAFMSCQSITEIVIPDGVTTIADEAFEACSALASVTIGESVTTIGKNAFSDCTALTDVTLNSPTLAGADYSTADTAPFFPTYFPNVTDLTFGSAVTRVGNYAANRSNDDESSVLESVTFLHEGGVEVGDHAFANNLKLSTVTGSVLNPEDYSFFYCTSLTGITFDDTTTSIGEGAFSCCFALQSMTLPSSLETIGASAFQNCESIAGEVTIPDGVQTIPDFAFAACLKLADVTLSPNVTSIGKNAFQTCKALTSVNIGDKVTTIDELAFDGCTALASATIGESVASIDKTAFATCTALTDVTFNSPTIASPSTAYSATSNLGTLFPYITTVTYGDKVTDIGQNSFKSNKTLQIVNIVGDAKNVRYSAFEGCTSLEKVNGAGVKLSISGTSPFYYCTSLKEITIAEGSTAIPKSAFFICRALTSIIIPEGVTSIGENAFYNSCIKNVTLPSTLIEIGSTAFAYCTRLKSVTNNSTDPQSLTESNQFQNVTLSNVTLYVPDASVEDYAEATVWKDFNIRGINWVDLTDGTAYERTEPLESGRVTYTRTFSNTSWQPLYIPFSMDYDEWKDRFDVAYINGIRQYDNDEDGKIDSWTMDVVYIKDGALYPNTPYLIKAHSTTSDPVIVENKTVYPAESNSIECSTTIMRYTFVGTYTQMTQTELEEENAYIMGGGKLGRPSSSGLKPYRWYLSVESRDPMYDAYTSVESIRIRVVGEDGEPEGIEDVVSDTNQEIPAYDLMGRRTEKSRKGFQVNNGVKVINL